MKGRHMSCRFKSDISCSFTDVQITTMDVQYFPTNIDLPPDRFGHAYIYSSLGRNLTITI